MKRGLAPKPHERAFTFLEILMVMAVMAMLMGLGIGYLQNIGKGARAQQARAVLRETVYACEQSSNGDTRAILDLRPDPEKDPGAVVVGAAVSRPVLTHNFEDLEAPSNNYPLSVSGKVESVPDGHTGRAAKFDAGGMLSFAPQAVFAVTDGFRLDVWLRIGDGGSVMTLLKGEDSYEVRLQRDQRKNAYDVMLILQLLPVDNLHRSLPTRTEFETKGAPLVPGLGWSHLSVEYDGRTPSIRVDGIEYYDPTAGGNRAITSADEGAQRILVPAGGAVALTISDPGRPYVGLMDNLVFGGVFRDRDTERSLAGLRLVSPKAPLRVVYRNGRLDPAVHTDDVLLTFSEVGNPDGPLLEFRLGLYGTVDERWVPRTGAGTGRAP